MELSTYQINKSIKKIIEPLLTEFDFKYNKGRKYWKYTSDLTVSLELRSLNGIAYKFGYPGISLLVDCGIFFNFAPIKKSLKSYFTDIYAPDEYLCHFRMGLDSETKITCSEEFLSNYPNETWRNNRQNIDLKYLNKNITNIWYIDPNGENIELALNDIRIQISKIVIPWINKYCSLNQLYSSLKKSRECPNKNQKLLFLSLRLNKSHEALYYYTKYREFLEKNNCNDEIIELNEYYKTPKNRFEC